METGTFLARDDTSLFYRNWQRGNSADYDILMIHGLLEHGGRYERFLPLLESQGIKANFYALDLRGHGRSQGARGDIDDFSTYVQDVSSFISEFIENRRSVDRPFILIGHSTGGLIVYLLQTGYYSDLIPANVSGVILSAPAFELAIKVPKWKDLASKALAKSIFKRVSVPTDFDATLVTHDLDIVNELKADSLSVDRITSRLWENYNEVMRDTLLSSGEINSPTLFLLAGDDKVVKTEAALRVFANLKAPLKDKIIYEGAYHEVFNEINRKEVLGDLVDWLQKNEWN